MRKPLSDPCSTTLPGHSSSLSVLLAWPVTLAALTTILSQVHTFKIDGFLATGADSQLGLANFYDLPVISSRPVFLPSILANGSLAGDYFAKTGDGRLDTVHPNCWGHRALGDFVVAYLEEHVSPSAPLVEPAPDHQPRSAVRRCILCGR